MPAERVVHVAVVADAVRQERAQQLAPGALATGRRVAHLLLEAELVQRGIRPWRSLTGSGASARGPSRTSRRGACDHAR